MRVFERLRDWWRGPSEVTYDELVTAYEWLSPEAKSAPLEEIVKFAEREADIVNRLRATLRKLGAE